MFRLPLLPPLQVPDPRPEQPPGMEGLLTILNWVSWLVLALCVVGFLISAARLAIARHNGEFDGAKGMVLALVACILIGSVSTIFAVVTG